jgi:cation diffusion facilitator CzcD-associated flavoprotein CzcO
VASLTIFQRTAPWVLPHRNRRITRGERALYRRAPAAQRFVRGLVYWSRELFAGALLRNSEKSLAKLEQVARTHLERGIPDPELRTKVTPEYTPGCKRLLPSNDWYPALASDNVEVVTDKIVEVTEAGLRTADGTEHPVDTIIFGTGFHVIGNPVAHRIRGADGRTLADHWAVSGMSAYLGTTVPAFPNLFLLAGPNTGIAHTSLVVMIEAQVRYVVDALRHMAEVGAGTAEVRRPVFDTWTEEMLRKAAPTVGNSGGCDSWYLDDAGRNPVLWPDYTFRFARRTRRFRPADYELLAPASPKDAA